MEGQCGPGGKEQCQPWDGGQWRAWPSRAPTCPATLQFPGRSQPAPSCPHWPAPFPSGMAACSDLLPAGLQFGPTSHPPLVSVSIHPPAGHQPDPLRDQTGRVGRSDCMLGTESQPPSLLFSAAWPSGSLQSLQRLDLTHVQWPRQACPSLAPGRSAASLVSLRVSGPAAHRATPSEGPSSCTPASGPKVLLPVLI